jgi:rod shape-determining protein MreC
LRDRKLLVAFVLLTIAILLNLPRPLSQRLKAASRDNLYPFQNLFSLLAEEAKAGLNLLTDAKAAGREKMEREEDIAQLRERVRELEALESENAALRRQIEFKSRQTHALVLGEVMARGDVSGWWQTLTLSRGTADGVRPDLAVITPEGIVGRVRAASRHTCEVLLITDPNCRMACRFPSTGAFGIVRGKGARLSSRVTLEMLCAVNPCQMDYIPKDSEVRDGDLVVTSGLGGVFPEGLMVGRVRKVGLAPSGLYQWAEIVPAANLHALRYAFVVLPSEAGTSAASPDKEGRG